MLSPRFLLPAFSLLIAATWLYSSSLGVLRSLSPDIKPEEIPVVTAEYLIKARNKAAAAREFVKQKDYNDKICFLLDMSLPSGQARFFVFDLKKDSLVNAGLVTHGRCYQDWLVGRKYSNTIGSGCTSLGKYKIGHSYHGRFGLAYKLHGMDKTNNNAYKRYVVLHAHECVPEAAGADEICQSDGCPTVSPGFLLYLRQIINASKKPLLLWIYE